MQRKIYWIVLMGIFFTLSGCDTALMVGGKTIGFSSGQFIFRNNAITKYYKFPIASVWEACDKTLADLKASSIGKNRRIGNGKINAIVQDEKATIVIEYVSIDMTLVSVSIGMAKNNFASELIHEKIAQHLSNP
jgi:hypothetical protein